jgi:hypothetical protein
MLDFCRQFDRPALSDSPPHVVSLAQPPLAKHFADEAIGAGNQEFLHL